MKTSEKTNQDLNKFEYFEVESPEKIKGGCESKPDKVIMIQSSESDGD